jgi:RNA methyltransferase, TrmH family
MIPLNKLAKLSPKHRMRKAALVLGELERSLLEGRPSLEAPEHASDEELRRWASGLAELLAGEGDCPQAVRAASAALKTASAQTGTELGPAYSGTVPESSFLRSIHNLRHSLLVASGQAPADWDLINPRTGQPDSSSRKVVPGFRAYLDDLRSPFNVGSIFRTADAFGLEELLLSPSCADPLHPRAQRSAMGAVDLVPWRRSSLDRISREIPIFALELGGQNLDEFVFPREGIVVLGSEELGISREARELCSFGTVSIPMSGAKGSLNVAVAFGILLYAWTSFISD